MVEGFPPMNTVFIDLDGTLIKGNSMKIFMKWLPLRLARKGDISAAIKAIWWISLRAFRLTSHPRMKWHLTRIAKKTLNPHDWEEIAERILTSVNHDVDRLLTLRRQEGDSICLATAAPSEYAGIIARKHGFEYVCATTFTPKFSDYSENKGIRKLNSIRNIIETEGLRLTLFLTDHHDDLPTIKAFPGKTLLVNPSQKTIDQCKNINIFDLNHTIP